MKTIINKSEFRGFAPDSDIEDAQLTVFLLAITDFIHTLVGDSLEEGPVTEYHKGNGFQKLYLDKRPIKSIESLKINSVKLLADDYRFDKESVILKNRIFYKGQDIHESSMASNNYASDDIEVNFTAGYVYPETDDNTQSTVPYDLRMACVGLINTFTSQTSKEGKLKSYAIADLSWAFKDFASTNKPFMDILRGYIPW